jgi:hypothetical protein
MIRIKRQSSGGPSCPCLLVRIPATIALLALILAGLARAGEKSQEKEEDKPAKPGPIKGGGRAPEIPMDEETVREIERLRQGMRGLGYVSWDSGIDPNLQGVTLNDPERASPGYNLYTDDHSKAFLIDMKGTRVHTWTLPSGKKWCEYAELLPNGDLISVCVEQSLTLLDWSSKVKWHHYMRVHHDVATLPDGGFLVPFSAQTPHAGRIVSFDGIATISSSGDLKSKWWIFEDLGSFQRLHPPSELDNEKITAGRPLVRGAPPVLDYYHLNTVEVLPDTPLGRKDPRFKAGNLLICLRNANLILVLDAGDHSIQWHWGGGELQLPHMPTMLENGHILVFDNGAERRASRVLEIDPPTGEILWKYEGNPPASFFSKTRGSNQRLPNGNTLICEADRGHAFEVTRDGETVWEYWNPVLLGNRRKRIYRFMRYPPSLVEPLLQGQERSAGGGSDRPGVLE